MPNLPIAEYRNRANRGAASEMIAAGYLIKNGYDVFRAISCVCPVDMVAWRDGEVPLRVEVKSGSVQKPNYHVFVKPRLDNWDLLLVVDTEDRVFAYPRADFTGDDVLRSYRTTQAAAFAATGSARSDDEGSAALPVSETQGSTGEGE